MHCARRVANLSIRTLQAAIASEQSVDYLRQNLPSDKVTLWTAALDQELTSKLYIVPGVGDVGDLAYGEKL